MYVLIGVLILVSAIIFFMWTPIEMFSNPEALKYPTPATKPQLVYFYLQECPHCKDFTPIWDDAVNKINAASLKVDMQKYDIQDNALAKKYNVNAAPTILYIDGETSTEYNGPRTADGLLAYVTSKTIAPKSS
jgi:thiol-disulfide isomerase/thioredoxin